jgi:hypothetical protein
MLHGDMKSRKDESKGHRIIKEIYEIRFDLR